MTGMSKLIILLVWGIGRDRTRLLLRISFFQIRKYCKCTEQVKLSRCLLCELQKFVLFRLYRTPTKWFWDLRILISWQTKIVRHTHRFHSSDWKFCDLGKKVICCVSTKLLQYLKIRKWTLFRIFSSTKMNVYWSM